MPTTRLAPSPTGALHLGNARTFLINWLLARQLGWKVILRIEDIDGPRIKSNADAALIDDLQWLGLDWDEGPIHQTARLPLYQDALQKLLQSEAAYPCICSRREIDSAASAPHAEDGSVRYPGICRDRFESVDQAQKQSGRAPAIRFRVPEEIVTWNEGFAGTHSQQVGTLGDFVIAKADGTPAYQLAVVVDDLAMGITHVVRGDDLLDSTPRQALLYRALHRPEAMPCYLHVPLVIGTDGRRLAKRHGDTRLAYYRQRRVPAGRLLALLAKWCGMGEHPAMRIDQMLNAFSLEKVPRTPIIFTAVEDTWLLSNAE